MEELLTEEKQLPIFVQFLLFALMVLYIMFAGYTHNEWLLVIFPILIFYGLFTQESRDKKYHKQFPRNPNEEIKTLGEWLEDEDFCKKWLL